MAAELATPVLMVAAAAVLSLGSKAVAQAGAEAVVNCAWVKALFTPPEQLVRTLQSYREAAVNPVRLAEVPVCAVETLVQVEALFSL